MCREGSAVGRFHAPCCLDHTSPSQNQPAQAWAAEANWRLHTEKAAYWNNLNQDFVSWWSHSELSTLPGPCSILHRLPLEKMQTL